MCVSRVLSSDVCACACSVIRQSSTLTTLLVWMMALAVGWESFHYIQACGYAVTLVGFFMFKEIIPMDWLFGPPASKEEDASNQVRHCLLEPSVQYVCANSL